MATNETGNYKNVANLNLFNGYIDSWGIIYNPAKTSITKTNLIALYAAGNVQIDKVQLAKNGYSTAVGVRKEAFADIHKFSTRIMGALSGTNVSADTMRNAQTINRKIQAQRAVEPDANPNNPIIPQPGDPTTTHSISRQSYDSLYENFQDYSNLLTNAPNYDPNEAEFQPAALTAYALNLKTKNEAIDLAIVEVSNSRITRNHFLYDHETGLVDIALDAKEYVKGLFGASSPEYKVINKISFRNRKA